MVFKTPLLLLLIPVVMILFFWNAFKRKEAAITFSSLSLFSGIPLGWKVRLSHLLPFFRLVILILLVVALSGPRKILEQTTHQTEGIDIVLAIDASGSMAAEDFKFEGKRLNRLRVVKNVVEDFINQRSYDRIGLVAFGGFAYTVCPLTMDYEWLKLNLDRVDLGILEDGTAIGSAIASSVNRLKKSVAKSKVIILLTDGVSNAGQVDPITAAKVAQQMKIKIYTIGAGSKGLVPIPVNFYGRQVYQTIESDLDEKTLQEIAQLTQGQYFRATDTESLKNIYKEIDSLEKTKIEEKGYKEYQELFVWFLWLGLFFLLVEIVLKNSLLMRIP